MALTNDEALDVVIGCVQRVGGRLIGPADSLSAGGIVDQGRLTSLKSQIVANQTLGVAKFQHRLDPAVLGNAGTGDSAQDTADVVRDNATPIAAAAVMAAPMGFAGAPSTGAARARSMAPPKPSAPPKAPARKAPKRKAKKAAAAKRGRKPAKPAKPAARKLAKPAQRAARKPKKSSSPRRK